MKNTLLILVALIICSCGTSQNSSDTNATVESGKILNAEVSAKAYAKSITAKELKEYLYTFAGDDFEGRDTGEPGQKKAAQYLKDQYKRMGNTISTGKRTTTIRRFLRVIFEEV